VQLGVQVVVTSSKTGTVVDSSPQGAPASLWSYSDPVISAVVITRARFANVSSSGNADAVPCPFGASSVWSCSDPSVMLVSISGSSFGACATDMNGMCLPANMQLDGVQKRATLLSANYTSSGGLLALYGEVWCDMSCSQLNNQQALPTLPPDQLVWVRSWSHSTVLLYVRQMAGTLRLQLESTTAAGEQATQTATRSFLTANPEISELAGVTTGIPTTGGTSPLQLSVFNLAFGNVVNVTVGNNVATLSCTCNGFTGSATAAASAANGMTAASGSCVRDLIAQQLAVAATGTPIAICVTIPAGQGSGAVVLLSRIDQATPPNVDKSNSGLSISYSPPILTAVEVWDAGVMTMSSIPGPYAQPVSLPTDGSATVVLRGSNLGSSPVVFMGDAAAAGSSVPSECPGTTGTHTCYQLFSAPGEGTGRQWPEYSTGYSIFLQAGDQPTTLTTISPAVVYRPAQVAAVVASVGTAKPTNGGVIVRLLGVNFGERVGQRPDSLLVVSFRDAAADPAGLALYDLSCAEPFRVSDYELSCILPEGSGVNLTAVVTVADVVGSSGGVLSYDRPSVSSAYVLPMDALAGQSFDPAQPASANLDSSIAINGVFTYPSTSPTGLRAFARGGDYVVLLGANFGVLNPAMHCVFGAWLARTTSAFSCDNRESFLGEGEVPSAQVVFWTHDTVVFAVNAGLGRKEVVLNVRGNILAGAVKLTYLDPVASGLSPNSGNTEGGDVIVISGSNFGPSQVDTRKGAVTFPGLLSKAPTFPTAFAVIVFHDSCVALGYDFLGVPVTSLSVQTVSGKLVQLKDCCVQTSATECSSIVAHNDASITFVSPPGVGSNKNVSVVVVDVGSFQSSNAVNFSYLPPQVQLFLPQVVRVNAGVSTSVQAYGKNFGNAELADQQGWSPLERQISSKVGTQPCFSVDRSRGSYFDGRIDTIVTCKFDPSTLQAGPNNFTVTIAGQTGFSRAWAPLSATSTTIDLGALILACNVGSFARVGEPCLPCPAQDPNGNMALNGATCAGYDDRDGVAFALRFPYPRPVAGWYNLNSSDANTAKWGAPGESQMQACPDSAVTPLNTGAASGRDVCIVPCDPPSSCLGDNVCARGYRSKSPLWKCSDCDLGFYHQGATCIKCPDSPWALVIGFTLLVVVAGCVGYFLNQKGVNIAVVSIGLDFFQVLAIFATSGVKWPQVVQELLHVLSAFNLNIEIVAPECIVPDLSYKAKFWFIMLLPLVVGSVFAVIFTSLFAYKALVLGTSKKEWFTHKPALVASGLALLYILYLYLTRTIFDVFNCTPTYPPDGYLHLSVAGSERCGVPGGTQLTLMPSAVAGLVIYSFGASTRSRLKLPRNCPTYLTQPFLLSPFPVSPQYPAFIGYTLYKNRELCMLDQLLKAKGTGDDKLSNPMAFELRQTYGRSYFQFKPDFCMWILAIILRKFFISITAVVFAKNSSFQMAACLLIMFLAYSAQMMARPYMNAGERVNPHAPSPTAPLSTLTNPLTIALRRALSHLRPAPPQIRRCAQVAHRELVR
jgi:hypothetical protein